MIWEAARATMANPSIYDPITIGITGQQEPFIGGGVSCNNPTAVLLEEAGSCFASDHVACIISVGSGQSQSIAISRSRFSSYLQSNLASTMKKIVTDCEHTAQDMEQRYKNTPDLYFRFNVEQGLQAIKSGQWEQLSGVATHTQQYMRQVVVDKSLKHVMIALIDRKRAIPISQIGRSTFSLQL
jgi:predicted acylesterase/phospholipase RssA